MMSNIRQCPALLVTAPSSGSGKATITAAIAKHFTRQGKIVQVFKVGPDFIGPTVLEVALERRVYQLDLWMMVYVLSMFPSYETQQAIVFGCLLQVLRLYF
ncbi:hypothetical protein [Pseudoalteromonas luteoviolacea]|uniref:nucleotide-binding protein n=1 Tax=Pseudoalteromonas luteoviolacea TaxID=43657 RepID=UPI0012DA3235|nr:hypothetical protein [Pseudoalteromonas luteoviolacea]